MTACFRRARPGEEDAVFALIAARVRWMDRCGIHQWNDTGYPETYPPDYYRRDLEYLYVLAEEDTGRILAAAMLFTRDDRRNTGEPSFYIHNLVSATDTHGAGARFLREAEALASREGRAYLRLDSADDNEKPASRYEALGFKPCGTCRDGDYHGILRQKRIRPQIPAPRVPENRSERETDS